MTLEEYAYLAQILGVIVVVITLVYLSIQVRQGASLLRSEARQAQVNNDQNNVYRFLEHPEIGRIYCSKETPSFEEKIRLNFWIVASMRAREHEWLQYRSGHLDQTTWDSYRNVIPFSLGTERARRLWQISKPAFNPDFVEMVDKMMGEAVPFTQVWDDIAAVA